MNVKFSSSDIAFLVFWLLRSGNQLITRKLKLIREFYFPCDGNKVKQFRINFISVTKVAKGALLIHTASLRTCQWCGFCDCTCPCVFWAHSFVEKIHLQYIYLAERIPLTHFRTGLSLLFSLFHLEFYRPNEDINPLSNWLLYNFAFGFSKLRWKLLYVLSRACWVTTYYGEESDDFIFSPSSWATVPMDQQPLPKLTDWGSSCLPILDEHPAPLWNMAYCFSFVLFLKRIQVLLDHSLISSWMAFTALGLLANGKTNKTRKQT